MAKVINNPTLTSQPVLATGTVNLASKAGSGGSGSSSGGGGTAASPGATTAAVDPMETLTTNYDAMVDLFMPEPASYEAVSAEELKKQVAAWLRPSYDQAVLNRQQQTKASAAELDADAISRGMGASTYVTDAKSRLFNEEARDVTLLESEYGAALASAVSDRLDSDRDRELEVTLYNKDLEMDVYSLAYSAALTLMGFSASGSSSGGRRTGSSRRSYSGSSSSSTGVTSARNVETFLSSLTKEQRAEVYSASTTAGQQYRDEIVASVGVAGYYEMQAKYSAIP
jgi:hypothetical protein